MNLFDTPFYHSSALIYAFDVLLILVFLLYIILALIEFEEYSKSSGNN